jgi:hypothetical protein
MNELINKFISATAGNPDLTEWAETNLGEPFTLFVGIDENNPPEAEHYPLLAVTEIRIAGGGASPRVTYEVDLAAGIKNETLSHDAANRTYTYEGILQADAFRARAFSALFAANFGKISIKDGAVGQSAVHPLYISGMTVSIEYINQIRRT